MSTNWSAIFKRIYYWMTPLLEHCPKQFFLRRTRRVQVYVIGTPRSGTVSLYDVFKSNFNAAHEPESRFFTHKVVAYHRKALGEQKMRQYLCLRDCRMGLEVDSAYLNGEVVDLLASEFPQSRFILVMRDAWSWVDSMMNFLLNKPEFMTSRKSHIGEHMRLQFGEPPYIYAAEESVLKNHGLHPLSCYLKYWSEQNQRVIDSVPSERLLVIKTSDISISNRLLADFLGLPAGVLGKVAHSNRAIKHHSLLEQLPKEFVHAQMEKYCGELMRRHFPEITARL